MAGMNAAQLRAYQDFAVGLADVAKTVALSYFRKPLAVDTKADESPVTIADREIEHAMRAQIEQHYPDHGILGEEHGRSGLDRDTLWVIDPIDGTKSFISGMPTFGVLIALLHKGVPVMGVIDHPALGERFVSGAGQPTYWNGAVCRTRGCRRLGDAILFATTPDMFDGDESGRFDRVSRAARVRRFGGDCFAYAMLAGGHVDAVVEAQLQPYDYMALVPMIEGAHGVITDWHGAPLTIHSDGRVVAAATPDLHAEILELLKR